MSLKCRYLLIDIDVMVMAFVNHVIKFVFESEIYGVFKARKYKELVGNISIDIFQNNQK